jgi:two-component system NtrC family sensor kinase
LAEIGREPVRRWLGMVVSSGKAASRQVHLPGLDTPRIYAVPAIRPKTVGSRRNGGGPPGRNDRGLLLIGARELDARAKRIWSLAAFSAEQSRHEAVLQQELQDTRQELQARIAAQTAAEQRLIQAAKLAAVGEMAAGVAHELNNPLTTIVGFTELVLEDLPESSPVRGDLETVHREALRARDVVRRLLDFSRRSEMIRTRNDINALIRDTLTLTHHLMHTSGVQVQTDLQTDLPWALVDGDQIKQVLLNLLHNALSAMAGGGRLEISTSTRQKYLGTWVTIRVQDTGVGIPSGNMERIFEPFFTTRAGEGGTGLGLAVTYGIVSSHGGMIEAESAPGAGAAFTVWLPVEETATP